MGILDGGGYDGEGAGVVVRQKGFMLYILIAVAIAFGLMLLALKVQSSRLESAKADLHVCETRYAETLKLVQKHNKAVQDLQKEAEKRARNAKAALDKARAEGKSKDDEIARLDAIKSIPAMANSCIKGVEAVRMGLK